MSDTNQQTQELKKLMKEVNSLDLPEIKLEEIAPKCTSISQNDFLRILKLAILGKNSEYFILDVRTSSEFDENGIPFAKNIPILNDQERHCVGLLYQQQSKKSAVSFAWHLAKKKEASFLKNVRNESAGKKIIIYCWRGGGRSRYVAKLLSQNGFNSCQLEKGQKGFRQEISKLLYSTDNKIKIISLSGITGCGKSEVLEYIEKNNPEFPIIHLEECAGHASSVFGEIRFKLRNLSMAKNQQDFEKNIFLSMLKYSNDNDTYPVFLSEKESKKIGNFIIPPAILNALLEEKHITLICPIKSRLERLQRDYFGDDNSAKEASELVKNKIQYLSRKLGNAKISKYNEWISNGQYEKFLEDIMINYYDKVYLSTKRPPLLSITNQSIEETVKILTIYWKSQFML